MRALLRPRVRPYSPLRVELLEDRLAPATLVSINLAGTDTGNGVSFGSTTNSFDAVEISSDGRYVVFQSNASNLNALADIDVVPNTKLDIFRRDLQTGTTETVNVNSAGTGNLSNAMPGRIAVSPNGRYVAFEYSFDGQIRQNDILPGVPVDNDGAGRLFLRDLETDTTILVSNSENGGGLGAQFSFSPDSRFLAYTDRNLEPGNTPNVNSSQLYVYEIATGNLQLASAVNGSTTTHGNGAVNGGNFVFSGNGRKIAFISAASNLTANDTNGQEDVFLRDLDTHTTTLISVNQAGTASASGTSTGSNFGPLDISADGTRVLFVNYARDIVSGVTFDSPSVTGVYVRDLTTNTTRIVNTRPGTNQVSGIVSLGQAHLTPNGRYAFYSTAGNAFRVDLQTDEVLGIDVRPDGSANGPFDSVGFARGVHQRTQRPMSDDGRYVVFQSNSFELVPNFVNGGTGFPTNVYIRDMKLGVTTLLSHSTAGNNIGANHNAYHAVISADGSRVAFQASATATNLTATDTNGTTDIYAAEVPTAVPVAGGPYVISEGDDLVLNASASPGQANPALTFSWDVNGDGSFSDATGVQPTLTWAQLQALDITNGPSAFQVSVRVDYGDGDVVTSSAVSLTVNNAPPTAAFSPSAGHVDLGNPVTFTFSNESDPSQDDVAVGFRHSYDFNNDGDFEDPGEAENDGNVSRSFTFATTGTFTVRGRIIDQNGGFTDLFTSVTILDYTSSVDPMPTSQDSATISLSWSGSVSAGDDGFVGFDVFVSDNGGPFTPLVENTQLTAATFTGVYGHSYGFYTVAIDEAGNREPAPTTAQATTTILTFENSATIAAGVVRVGATTANDTILLAPTTDLKKLQVTINGRVVSKTINLSAIQQIRVFGRDGADTMSVTNLAKPLYVEGGNGSDKLTITGRAAANTFTVNATSVLVNGTSAGLDSLETIALVGKTKNDVLTVQAAPTFAVSFNGGAGIDRIQAANIANTWTMTGAAAGSLNTSITFAAIETLTGGTAEDTLTGPSQNNTWRITSVDTGKLNAVSFTSMQNLSGGSFADTFILSDGIGLSGAIAGGSGRNTLSYAAYLTGVAVDLEAGTASNLAGISGISDVHGGSGNDVLTGDDGDNLLIGNAGNDELDGDAGNDTLIAGAGSDTATGGIGRDLLFGGTGVDNLEGGAEDDVLVGGIFNFYSESTRAANTAALNAILAEWTRTDTAFASRVDRLLRGGGLNKTFLLSDATVHNDGGTADALLGEDGTDWFLVSTGDQTPDRDLAGEVRTVVA